MQFLLFFSAMLAGLTGLISGDRAVETRRVESSAVAVSAAVEVAAEAAEAASFAAAVRPVSTPALRAASASRPGATDEVRPDTAPVDERRLE